MTQIDVVPIKTISAYHAHIYFQNPQERETAAILREEISRRFSVQLGRWHNEQIGPHALPMYQVAFSVELFAQFVPWLALNRKGLRVLIHPNTANERRDHVVHALWLGEMLPIIRPEQLRETADAPSDPVMPNTQPDLDP